MCPVQLHTGLQLLPFPAVETHLNDREKKDPPPENFTGPDWTITVVLASSAPSPSLGLLFFNVLYH